MVMLLSVTPWSVAPFALPGPQGETSVPNVLPDEGAVVAVCPVPTAPGCLRGLVQAVPITATVAIRRTQRDQRCQVLCSEPPSSNQTRPSYLLRRCPPVLFLIGWRAHPGGGATLS